MIDARLRVLIADDHELIADGLAVALGADGIESTVVTGPTVEAIVAAASEFRPDVVLLDLDLGGGVGSGLHLISPLSDLGASVVMLTGVTDDESLAECLEAGAYGLARKSEPFDRLVGKVHAAAEGREVTPPHERFGLLDRLQAHRRDRQERLAPFEALTAREADVLAGLLHGLQAEAIARRSFVSISTVRSQIRSILQKLEVNSQLAAVALARDAGWVPADQHPSREGVGSPA